MKRLLLWLLLLASGLMAAYALFAGLVSVRVGVRHSEQDGSLLAVLAGAVCIFTVLFLFLRFSRALFNRRKEMDLADL